MSQPPTGYADRADAWVNTGALVNRMNFAVSLANNKIPGVRVDFCRLAGRDSSVAAPDRLPEPRGYERLRLLRRAKSRSSTERGWGPASAKYRGEGLTAHGGGAPCAVKIAAARDRLMRALLRDDVSSATASTLKKATDVSQLAALTIGAPEFQRR
jgi:uncharacterized protein (DUF1800 family)